MYSKFYAHNRRRPNQETTFVCASSNYRRELRLSVQVPTTGESYVCLCKFQLQERVTFACVSSN